MMPDAEGSVPLTIQPTSRLIITGNNVTIALEMISIGLRSFDRS